jgi:acetolactate synthase-1/2/3 large subunit
MLRDLTRFAEAQSYPSRTPYGPRRHPGDHPLFTRLLGMHGRLSEHGHHRIGPHHRMGGTFDRQGHGLIRMNSRHTPGSYTHRIDPTSISKNIKVDIPIVGDFAQCPHAYV